MLRKYIGDKAFYKRVLVIAIPMMIQNGITNFVSLLDNIMVGQVGTAQMSGVSIVNQLMFVFNLTIFGLTTGAGIFTAQFHGSRDVDGVRYTFRYKFISSMLATLGCIAILFFAQTPLITTFLQGEGTPEDAAEILKYGKGYLLITLWGMIPFALNSVYCSTLRECGQTVVPMISGITAVFTNLILNYIFIFGKLGLPAMGAEGAALATTISRFIELAIVAIWTHTHPEKNPFVKGVFCSLRIPLALLGQLLIRCLPLLLNELSWALAKTFMNQCYSTCSLEVMSAINIMNTLNTLSNVVSMSLGNTLGILLGQMLGAGCSKDEVWKEYKQLIALVFATSALFGILLAAVAHAFPMLYNTTDSIRDLTTALILIMALIKPVSAYVMAAYHTLRCGGNTLLTFAYDGLPMFLLGVPLAFILSRYTDISILPLYFICQMPDVVKMIAGMYMIRSRRWMNRLTEKTA